MRKNHDSQTLNYDQLVKSRKTVFLVIPPRIGVRDDDEAGIQVGTGCRIKSGMTELPYLVAGLICRLEIETR